MARQGKQTEASRLEVSDSAGRKRRLSLRQIEVFRAVMTTGSINAAGKALGVTQPTLSRVIRRMEDVVGLRVCASARGRLVSTKEAGALLALVGRKAFRSRRSACRTLSRAPTACSPPRAFRPGARRPARRTTGQSRAIGDPRASPNDATARNGANRPETEPARRPPNAAKAARLEKDRPESGSGQSLRRVLRGC